MGEGETKVVAMVIERLDRIEDRLDEMVKHQIDNPLCPRPGTCVELSSIMAREAQEKGLMAERVMKLERWRSWVTGIAAAGGCAWVLFGATVKKMIGLD